MFFYIDDMLIASKIMEEHMEHFQLVFNHLQHFGLKINTDECIFDSNKLSFLKTGISLLPEKIAAAQSFP